MRKRLKILKSNNLKIQDINNVISTLSPLEGATELLKRITSELLVIILSDTFYEFIGPIMKN